MRVVALSFEAGGGDSVLPSGFSSKHSFPLFSNSHHENDPNQPTNQPPFSSHFLSPSPPPSHPPSLPIHVYGRLHSVAIHKNINCAFYSLFLFEGGRQHESRQCLLGREMPARATQCGLRRRQDGRRVRFLSAGRRRHVLRDAYLTRQARVERNSARETTHRSTKLKAALERTGADGVHRFSRHRGRGCIWLHPMSDLPVLSSFLPAFPSV